MIFELYDVSLESKGDALKKITYFNAHSMDFIKNMEYSELIKFCINDLESKRIFLSKEIKNIKQNIKNKVNELLTKVKSYRDERFYQSYIDSILKEL